MHITMMNYKFHLGERLQKQFLQMVEMMEKRHDRREIWLLNGALVAKLPEED